TLLLVLVPERSTAKNICPESPTPFIPPSETISPPRLTPVVWSKVSLTPPFLAFDERTHEIWPLKIFTPPIKRLPLLSTSSVPHDGCLGMMIGFNQVKPPSVERVNCLCP